MPREMGALIEELLLSDGTPDKDGYYREVMQSILETGQADAMIIALSRVIQALAIDRLHIIGDIFDRGPRADLIMDALETYHQVDVQWGNHDIAWMGAAALSEACIAQVIVTSVKYGNLENIGQLFAIQIVFAAEIQGHTILKCQSTCVYDLQIFVNDNAGLPKGSVSKELGIGIYGGTVCQKLYVKIACGDGIHTADDLVGEPSEGSAYEHRYTKQKGKNAHQQGVLGRLGVLHSGFSLLNFFAYFLLQECKSTLLTL